MKKKETNKAKNTKSKWLSPTIKPKNSQTISIEENKSIEYSDKKIKAK